MKKFLHIINSKTIGGAQVVVNRLVDSQSHRSANYRMDGILSFIKNIRKARKESCMYVGHLFNAHVILLILKLTILRSEKVAYYHHSDIHQTNKIWAKFLFLITENSYHIFPSIRMMQSYSDIYRIKKKMHIKNPISDEFALSLNSFNSEVRYKYGYIGRFDSVKRVVDIAEKFKSANLNCIFIGNGPCYFDLKELSEVNKNITIMPYSEIINAFNQFEILIIASKREVYPNILVEALALKKKIILVRSEYGVTELSQAYNLKMIEMGELEYSIANKINVNGGDFPYSLGLNKNVLADHSVKECYLKFEYLYDLA